MEDTTVCGYTDQWHFYRTMKPMDVVTSLATHSLCQSVSHASIQVQLGLQVAKETMAENDLFSLAGIIKIWRETIETVSLIGYSMFLLKIKH